MNVIENMLRVRKLQVRSVVINLKSRAFFGGMLLFHLIVFITILFDVPVVRQIVGFIYFTFFPGLIMIKLFKMDEFDGLTTVLYSVGFSISFLMFIGLLINELSFLVGILNPLSSLPLLISFCTLILLGNILIFIKGDKSASSKSITFDIHPFSLVYLGILIITILGIFYLKTQNSNLILLSMIIIISALFAFSIIFEKLIPSKLYPIFIFILSLSLLLHSSLVSNYLTSYRSDASREFYTFITTKNNGHWTNANPYSGDIRWGRVYSMLSVTILPTIYSELLHMEPTWIFKIIFPLLFSFIPLSLYKLWKEFYGSKFALISTFFFISVQTFYFEMLGVNRESFAKLFFVLILSTILTRKIKARSISFIILSAALITSHYGLAEIFLIFLLAGYIIITLMKRPTTFITLEMIIIFLVMMFSWYIFTADSSAFDSTVEFGGYVLDSLNDIFILNARSSDVLKGLGLVRSTTFWSSISRGFAYATEVFMVIGFLGLITKKVKMNLDVNVLIFSIIAMTFLALLIIIPGLAPTMNMTRFYHTLLIFLAPFFCIGAKFISELMHKKTSDMWTPLLIVAVIVPYFLFQTGFIYVITGNENWSFALGKPTSEISTLYLKFGYISELDFFSSRWLSKYIEVQNTQIYSDLLSRGDVLTCYGQIYRNDVIVLSNVTSVAERGIIYLNSMNVIENKIVGTRYTWKTNEFPFVITADKIYSNGGTEILIN